MFYIKHFVQGLLHCCFFLSVAKFSMNEMFEIVKLVCSFLLGITSPDYQASGGGSMNSTGNETFILQKRNASNAIHTATTLPISLYLYLFEIKYDYSYGQAKRALTRLFFVGKVSFA